MDDRSGEILDAIREIRDLIRLMAEPAIAERDKKLRRTLREIVGNSVPKTKAVFLMDGTRTQRVIHRESGCHEGHLSTLVKKLGEAYLLSGDSREPKLAISIPTNFFENGAENE